MRLRPSPNDLLELDDHGQRLFLGGHRWAYESAEPAHLIAGASKAAVLLATPASLALTKSHALGFASQRRRTTKRGPDMLDLFRLIETFNRDGALAAQLRLAPGHLAAVVAEVVTREILAQPASAARLMSTLTPGPVTVDDIGDVLDLFVADLMR